MYLQYVFKNLFDMHFLTTCPRCKQTNSKQRYDSYGTYRLETSCFETFWHIFYILNLDLGTAAMELCWLTGLPLVGYFLHCFCKHCFARLPVTVHVFSQLITTSKCTQTYHFADKKICFFLGWGPAPPPHLTSLAEILNS